MSKPYIPDWIKQRKQENLEKKSLKVKDGGQDFWRNLLEELKVNTESLSLIEARGTANPFENLHTRELSCRVEIFKEGISSGLTYTDLFYRPGDYRIRSLTQEGFSMTYQFLVSSCGELSAVPNDSFDPKSPREIAESIVFSMMEKLEHRL